jgi:hypothetical protein
VHEASSQRIYLLVVEGATWLNNCATKGLIANLFSNWCGRRESNPHGLAPSGF